MIYFKLNNNIKHSIKFMKIGKIKKIKYFLVLFNIITNL